jgi:PST family polysaccharide transporter
MNLFKSSVLNGIAVATRMGCLLVLNKILAVYVGPSGYALIGQLQNIISSILTLSTGGISSGVVKYTAECEGNDAAQSKLWKTAVTFSLVLTIIVASVLLYFSEYIAVEYLKNNVYKSILSWFSLFLFLNVLNSIGLSIINGKRKTKDYVLINIISSLFSLIYTAILVYYFNIYGALFSLISNQAVVCVFTFYIGIKREYFSFKSVFGAWDLSVLKKLSGFSTMIIIPSILWPICYTFVRQLLTTQLGQEYAGNWDAIWKLSNVYLSFLTAVLGVYFLPKLASLKTTEAVRKEVFNGYKLIVPFTMFLCFLVYINKLFIVKILFTEEFSLMLDLFKYQVIGDFFKIISWVMSYAIMAKAMIKRFLALELIFISFFAFLCDYYIKSIGFEGVAFAHFLNNLAILIVTSLVFFVSSFNRNENK